MPKYPDIYKTGFSINEKQIQVLMGWGLTMRELVEQNPDLYEWDKADEAMMQSLIKMDDAFELQTEKTLNAGREAYRAAYAEAKENEPF